MRYIVNDNLHSQLSKATRPAQCRIDDEAPKPAAEAYGKVRALEIESEEALTDFTMGGSVTGVAWSINPYVGCLHACRYCYVPNTMHVERQRWGTYVVAKHNLPQRLRKELKHRKRLSVYISTSTDPYQAPEREHGITRACLRLLAREDWPVEVLTRSPLVLRDLDILKRLTRVRVGLSVPTIDDEARQALEPAAPAIPARLSALRKVADAGLPVFANYTPAYPPTNGHTMADVAEAFAKAGVHWINTTGWRRIPHILGPLWDRFHKTPWARLVKFIGDEKGQEALYADLVKEMRRVDIPVHTGFFNPPFDLAEPYEATSQMKLEVEESAPEPVVAPWWGQPAGPLEIVVNRHP